MYTRSNNPYDKPVRQAQSGTILRTMTLPQYYPPSRTTTTINTIPPSVITPTATNSPTTSPAIGNVDAIQRLLTFTKEENKLWGDTIDVKCMDTTRIYFQNINGIQVKKGQAEKWKATVETLSDAAIDIAGFAETNTNWAKKTLKKQMSSIIRKKFKQVNMTTSRNDVVTPSSYLPGGIMLTCTDHWTGRVVDHIQDPTSMGRWCGQKLRLKEGKHAYIISAYRPVKHSITDATSGNQTVYVQQHNQLRRKGFEDPKPRQQFIDDMINEILKLKEDKNASIILMLDANEVLGQEKKGISLLLKKTGLIDVFSRFHQNECAIATNIKSVSRRIDFIFTSPNVLPYVSQCGYLPFYKGFDSDHRGLFLDIHSDWIDGKIPLGVQLIRSIGT